MRAIVVMLAAILCCSVVHAQVPRQINYQGYLAGPDGITPVNATVSMQIRLYAAPAGPGAALYTQTQTVAVNNGVFNVLIGRPRGSRARCRSINLTTSGSRSIATTK
ncbi:MAG: hypothetical protein IPO58_17085 [Betaproteobacteria bacterium]|nr:hypothetical protein [Betaproteobacteria bacterium]